MPNEIKQVPDFTEEGTQAVKEEKETSSVPATEENQQVEETPQEESKEEPVVEEPVPEEKPKAVEGLQTELSKLEQQNQDKEKEIRTRIVDARRKRRELNKPVPEEEPVQETVDDLSDIDEESKKSVARILRVGGYVKKEEVNKITFDNTFKLAEESFFKTHSEYTPENDDDDLLYNALQEEVGNFSTPKDHGKIAQLFEKAHIIVQNRYPSRFSQAPSEKPDEVSNRAEVAALVGGRSGVASTPTKKSAINQKQVDYFRGAGWSDEDIKELMD